MRGEIVYEGLFGATVCCIKQQAEETEKGVYMRDDVATEVISQGKVWFGKSPIRDRLERPNCATTLQYQQQDSLFELHTAKFRLMYLHKVHASFIAIQHVKTSRKFVTEVQQSIMGEMRRREDTFLAWLSWLYIYLYSRLD